MNEDLCPRCGAYWKCEHQRVYPLLDTVVIDETGTVDAVMFERIKERANREVLTREEAVSQFLHSTRLFFDAEPSSP